MLKSSIMLMAVALAMIVATSSNLWSQVVVSLSPPVLHGGEDLKFIPTVTGAANTAVIWSASPKVGKITNGIYQAPSIIANQQNVTITAMSVVDSTKTASTIVTLMPIGVTVEPASVSLGASASATFRASVIGTSNTTVNWSLSPAMGTIANGVYTAPATIGSVQAVTLTATTVADPTKTANATITLMPPVVVSLSPGNTSVTGGQTATFTSTVGGSANTAVTWSMNPAVGAIANGVYQAPAIIASQQNITVTATSVANPAKSASATVLLQPVGVTVGPASVSLGANASATFSSPCLNRRFSSRRKASDSGR